MEQRLTPRLIQSMAVLQKPVADLETYIEDALEANAALEVAEPEAVERDSDEAPDDSPRSKSEETEAAGFERLERFSREQGLDWMDRPFRKTPRTSSSGEIDAKMGAMANTEGREIGLNEYLINQWSLSDVSNDLRDAGEAIINKLDPDGYLRIPLEEVGQSLRSVIAPEVLQEALRHVQKLDPIGVGSRDTVECLLLQLDALPGDNQIERALVEKHLNDITHNRLPAVAKATGYSIGEINEAIKAMRERGVITRVKGDSILLAPPLVTTPEQIDRIIEVVGESINAVLP